MKSLKPILYAGAVCGVLDITAACINARVATGLTPVHLLQSVAGGLLGRSTYEGGSAAAALGLVMHFTMALTWRPFSICLPSFFRCPKSFRGSFSWDCFMDLEFL